MKASPVRPSAPEAQSPVLEKCSVLEVEELTSEYYLLTLEVPGKVRVARGGLFAQLSRPDPTGGFALPRPFSLFRVEPGRLTFLIRVAGRFTTAWRKLIPGAEMLVLYPLGNGFPETGGRTLLVGGGVGVAPLLLQRSLSPVADTLVAGFRRGEEFLALQRRFPDLLDSARVASEDGTVGSPGLVTVVLKDLLARDADYEAALVCGPQAMMAAVVPLLAAARIPVWVSLETYMGCGSGLCVGCAVELAAGGYALSCRRGPVFAAGDLAAFAGRVGK